MQTSKVSFNGVTPYRVFINGMPSTDPQNIQRAQRALVKILVGPTNKNQQHQKISAIFAQGDRDYSYERAYNGYLQVKGETAVSFPTLFIENAVISRFKELCLLFCIALYIFAADFSFTDSNFIKSSSVNLYKSIEEEINPLE